MAGDWDMVVTQYEDGEVSETSKGTATFTPMMGGRCVRGTYKGTMMGQPFEGMSLDGYDNVTGKFWSTWIDNMGTSLSVSHGERSEDGTTLEHWGSMPDPMGGEDWSMHSIITYGKDTCSMQMFISMPDSGDETLSMTVEYTRKKAKKA
jgi:hypothetical protein